VDNELMLSQYSLVLVVQLKEILEKNAQVNLSQNIRAILDNEIYLSVHLKNSEVKKYFLSLKASQKMAHL
jgi:hypothetical protein